MLEHDASTREYSNLPLTVGFAGYLLWMAIVLMQLDSAEHYNFTPWICGIYILVLIMMPVFRRLTGFQVSRPVALVCSLTAGILGVVYYFTDIEAIRLAVMLIWELLGSITLFFWGGLLSSKQVDRIIPPISWAGLGSSAILLLGFAGTAVFDLICIFAPLASACGLFCIREGSTEQQAPKDLPYRSWPLPLVIFISAFCSSTFTSMLYSPFIINSADTFLFDAVIGILLAAALLFWTKTSGGKGIIGFLLATLIVLELGLLALATGFSESITFPVDIISAADYALSLLVWILMVGLVRSTRTKMDYMAVFAIGMGLSSGVLGHLVGFALIQTIDIPFNTLKILAAVLLAIFAALFLIFSMAEVFAQRSNAEETAEKKIASAVEQTRIVQQRAATAVAEAQQQAVEKTQLSRERSCEILCENHQLTARETESVKLLMRGCTRTEIAEEWVVSENTVKYHLRNAYRKLDVHNARELNALIDQRMMSL